MNLLIPVMIIKKFWHLLGIYIICSYGILHYIAPYFQYVIVTYYVSIQIIRYEITLKSLLSGVSPSLGDLRFNASNKSFMRL